MTGMLHIVVDLTRDTLVLCGRNIALRPSGTPFRWLLENGSSVRALTFGERADAVEAALAAGDPASELLRRLRALAWRGPADPYRDAIVLALAGAAERAPAFAACAEAAAHARRCELQRVRAELAIEVDRSVPARAEAAPAPGSWRRFEIAPEPLGPDELSRQLCERLLERGAGDAAEAATVQPEERALLEARPTVDAHDDNRTSAHPSAAKPATARAAARPHAQGAAAERGEGEASAPQAPPPSPIPIPIPRTALQRVPSAPTRVRKRERDTGVVHARAKLASSERKPEPARTLSSPSSRSRVERIATQPGIGSATVAAARAAARTQPRAAQAQAQAHARLQPLEANAPALTVIEPSAPAPATHAEHAFAPWAAATAPAPSTSAAVSGAPAPATSALDEIAQALATECDLRGLDP